MINKPLTPAQSNLLAEIAVVTDGSPWTNWFNGAGLRTLNVLVRVGAVELGKAEPYTVYRDGPFGRTRGALPSMHSPVLLTPKGRAMLAAQPR